MSFTANALRSPIRQPQQMYMGSPQTFPSKQGFIPTQGMGYPQFFPQQQGINLFASRTQMFQPQLQQQQPYPFAQQAYNSAPLQFAGPQQRPVRSSAFPQARQLNPQSFHGIQNAQPALKPQSQSQQIKPQSDYAQMLSTLTKENIELKDKLSKSEIECELLKEEQSKLEQQIVQYQREQAQDNDANYQDQDQEQEQDQNEDQDQDQDQDPEYQ